MASCGTRAQGGGLETGAWRAGAERDGSHSWQFLAEVEKLPEGKEGCRGLSKGPRRYKRVGCKG